MKKFAVILIRALMWLPARLPLKLHYACSSVIAWLLRSVFRYRRDVVMTNLSRSFPEKKYKELTRIADASYRHLADLIVEAVWFGGSSLRRLHRAHIVEYTNPEVLNRMMTEGKGAVVMTSHCGNWELTGGILAYNFKEEAPWAMTRDSYVVVYKKMKSAVWDEVLARNRKYPMPGYENYIETYDVMRFIVRHRRQKMCYLFPTDQAPYKGAAWQLVPSFMNQPTPTMTGGAAVAHKLGCGVLFMNYRKVCRGRYEIDFIPVCEDASALTPLQIMERYYALLESLIQQDPTNYNWTHRRWKKRVAAPEQEEQGK